MTKPQLPPGVIPIGATHFHHNPVIEKPTSNPWRKKCGDGWLAFYDGEWRGCNGSKAHLFVAIEDVLGKKSDGEWAAYDLPPIGTICGFCRFPETPEAEWTKVKIVAHYNEGLKSPVAIFMSTSYSPQADQAVAACFRPILTAEQIAANERDEAIQQMIDDTNILTGIMSDRRIMAGQLYDAGYRKTAQ